MDTLSGPALEDALERWIEQLGPASEDARRLRLLKPLAGGDGRFRLSACLDAIYPGLLSHFTAFRARINGKAGGLGLTFEADNQKSAPPEQRFCWVTGPDRALEAATAFTLQATQTAETTEYIAARGIDPGKRTVRLFVSYSHREDKIVKDLLDKLTAHFGASKTWQLELWKDDQSIDIGAGWHEAIQKGLRQCHYGLVMVSPRLLGSRYIGQHELPALLARDAVLPIAIAHWAKDADMKGLDPRQIFGHDKPYADCRTKPQFVLDLYEKICRRLEKSTGPALDPAAYVPVPDPETREFIPTFGLSGYQAQRINPERVPAGRPAIEVLTEWALNPESYPLFALLGEYGIGKTTTLRQFTRDLIERRKNEPGTPLPIYIDLREHRGAGVPSLDELLQAVIARWPAAARALTPGDLKRLAAEGALVIFDGLDEKTVHLEPAEAQQFIRNLWGMLPPREPKGKLLVSCRSHYFRDLATQHALLTGEGREAIEGSRYPVLDLLPFSSFQIREYLERTLGADRVEATVELLHFIHNLEELSARPYLLKLIAGHIDELAVLRARGETVNAARLYELFVETWLARDLGKHQIDPGYKRELMEELAAALWRSGERTWSAGRLEKWLDGFLAAHPAIAQALDRPRAVLKADLRTATLLVRPAGEERDFRFAHTSLQEFFLASYLVRALRERQPQAWDLPLPSVETLDFAGQLLALDRRGLDTLAEVAAGASLPAARLALAYLARAGRNGHPMLGRVDGFRLAGAELEGWELRGLQLPNADLRGARLSRCRMESVDLRAADLTGAALRDALFLDVRADRVRAASGDWSGLQWRGGSVRDADLSQVNLAGAQWIRVSREGAAWPAQALEDDERAAPQHACEWTLDAGHGARVAACAFSPDGRLLLSGSFDHTLKLWDAETGQCLRTLPGHTRGVYACAFSPDGRRLLSGSYNKTLKLWDAETGRCLRTLSGHAGPVRTCAFSPDGRHLLSGSGDKTLKLWDAGTCQCLSTLRGHTRPVFACAFSPDGRRLLSGSEDKKLRLWDAETGECLRTLAGHTAYVSACVFSPDGRRLLSGSGDKTLKLWDAETGECLRTLPGHSRGVYACAFSPDGHRLLSGSDEKTLKLWDAETGECLRTLPGHADEVRTCAFSPDGHRLLSGSDDRTLKLWDTETGECLRTLRGHAGGVYACAFSPDGRRLLSGSGDHTLRLWDLETGECLRTRPGHTSWVLARAFSPDGRRLLSGSFDNTLKLWDVETGECLRTLRGHDGWVYACTFSPDGRRLLSGSDDKRLKLWDAETGKCLRTLPGHTGSVYACAFSPDGRRLLSGSNDNTLKLWVAETGKCLRTLPGHTRDVYACAFSPDGRRLLSGSVDHTLKFWDAETGKCLRTLSGHTGYVSACAFSPDGRRLLSGSEDHTLRLWDAKTGECMRTLPGHTGSVYACAFSPDGRRLLSGSDDNTLKLWDAETGECRATFHHLPERATATFAGANLVHAGGEAWRWLAWRWRDPRTGRLRLLPAEHFGPLPTAGAIPPA